MFVCLLLFECRYLSFCRCDWFVVYLLVLLFVAIWFDCLFLCFTCLLFVIVICLLKSCRVCSLVFVVCEFLLLSCLFCGFVVMFVVCWCCCLLRLLLVVLRACLFVV